METQESLLNLYVAERQKIISELRFLFPIEIEIIEDLVSDTFLSAAEFWRTHGLPQNPTGWLHTVAKNKAKNHLKKRAIFNTKLSPMLKLSDTTEEIEIDFSKKTIEDSQLAMIFAICNPCLPNDAQVGLALNLLCGFGIQEIADAFFTTKHVIYKRLERAKERLKINNIQIVPPTRSEIDARLDNVLNILYLLFSEGHFSMSQESTLRESFCTEAMRLNCILIENPITNTPAANALFALMCFHSSRFAARIKVDGTLVPYDEQDETHWDKELIAKGLYHLNIAAAGERVSKFHLEAGIAYWHTKKEDTPQKWESVLGLYNKLLAFDYSPVAALNQAYALSKVRGKTDAITAAESLQLTDNLFYHSLLSFLYNGLDNIKSLHYSKTAALVSNFSTQRSAVN